MINTSISKYFTADYRQYMIYIKDIKDRTINILKKKCNL